MNRRIRLFFFLLLSFLFTAGFAYASDAVFTLTQLIEKYLNNSYDGRIRSEQLLRQQYALDNTKAAFLPKITARFKTPGHYYSQSGIALGDSIRKDYNYLSGDLTMTETFPFNADLSFSNSLSYNFYEDETYINTENNINFNYYLFKRNTPKLEYEKSKLAYEKLTFTQKTELNADIIALVQNYYDAINQKITIRIMENKLARNRNITNISDMEYTAGTTSILTRNQLRVQEKQTELELSEQKKTYAYYLQNLADQIDQELISDIIIDTMLFSFNAIAFNPENNPKIRSLTSQLDALELDERIAESAFDWYLTLGVDYTWGGNGDSFDSFSKDIKTDTYSAYIGVELPIFDGRITRRNILGIRSQKEEIKLQLEQKKKELRTRWNYLTDMISLLKHEIESYAELVQWSKDNLEVATGMLLRGEMNYSDWSNIEEDYENHELNHINKKLTMNKYILETQQILGNNLADVIIP